jgi:outer membrane protein assembly factor BamB
MRRVAVLLAGLLAAAALQAGGTGGEETAGWPQWGGPLRSAASPATGVWGKGAFQLREAWRRPVGEGISALTFAGGRLFFIATDGDKRFAFAISADTGAEIWRVPLAATPVSLEYGPASTPATDGKLAFFLSPECELMALDVATGRNVWQHNLKKEYDTGPMASGCWTSPLLAGGKLLVVDVNGEPNKRVAAFDKDTGTVVWQAAGAARLPPRTSPALGELAGVKQVLIHDAPDEIGGVLGLRASDGAQLLSLRFHEENTYSFDMPLVLPGDRVAVLTWSDFRVFAVRKQGSGLAATPLWSTHDVRAELQPFNFHAVYHDGHIYASGGDYLSCLDLETGRTIWKQKTYRSSLLLVDGKLILVPQASGVLRIVEATPEGYREKLQLPVFQPGAPTDTPATFAGHRLFLRNSEELVALDVVPQAAAVTPRKPGR